MLGGALAVLDPEALVDVAVLEADPLVVLPVPVEEALEAVVVEFEADVADAEEDDPVEVDEPEAELEEGAGPPVISNRTLKLGTLEESSIWRAYVSSGRVAGMDQA